MARVGGDLNLDYAWPRMAVLALAAMLGPVAYADYGEECRALSAQLAREPGSLKVGDLDVLKTCLSDLQRLLIVGGQPPEGVSDLCPAPVVEPQRCPVCPSAAQLCGKRDAPRDAPSARDRRDPEREPSPDRQLKPALPVF